MVSNLQTPTAHLSYKCAVGVWRFETRFVVKRYVKVPDFKDLRNVGSIKARHARSVPGIYLH